MEMIPVTHKEKIRERGVLKVGTTGDYQPLSYFDFQTGRYIGFDAELAEDLADELNVEIEYVPTSWPSLMDDVRAGKFDLAVCGITITGMRKEQALMSEGYLENGINIHRLSRWFFRCGHSPARKAALYSANVVCASILLLFTRKRVLKLQFQLFCFFVFLQLVLNVFCYLLCILSYSVHIKSSAPE